MVQMYIPLAETYIRTDEDYATSVHLEYDIDELFVAVRAAFEQPTSRGGIEWLDGAPVSSDTLLVIYRHRGHETVFGVFVNVEEEALSPDSILADAVLAIEEPSQGYLIEDATWADRFGRDSSRIVWRGDLPPHSTWTPWNPPPVEYPPNSRWFIGFGDSSIPRGSVTYSAGYTRLSDPDPAP